MDKMECEYCKKVLSNKYTLTQHQKKTKSCLELQNKMNIDNPNKPVETPKEEVKTPVETPKEEVKTPVETSKEKVKTPVETPKEDLEYTIKHSDEELDEEELALLEEKRYREFILEYMTRSHEDLILEIISLRETNFLLFQKFIETKYQVSDTKRKLEEFDIKYKKLVEIYLLNCVRDSTKIPSNEDSNNNEDSNKNDTGPYKNFRKIYLGSNQKS